MLVDDKDLMPEYTRLNETAERHGFLIAYPNAVGGAWGLWPRKIVDDIAFFDALLARLSADYRIDPDRIYLLGMSNGGYFAHLLAKERSTTVAAVASHSGPLGLQTLFGVNAARKFPVLIVHGTQDWIFSPWLARENAEKYRREGHAVKYVEVAGLGHGGRTASTSRSGSSLRAIRAANHDSRHARARSRKCGLTPQPTRTRARAPCRASV